MRKIIYIKSSVLLVCLITIFTQNVRSQDQIYSQFFNAPVYLNPALNGQFNGSFRMNMIYRNQWSGMSADLSYLSASLDYQLPRFGGGVGLLLNSSTEGTAYLKKNNISGIYSYSVGSDGFEASFGLQAGITNRKLDFSKLVFSDQINSRTGFDGSATLAEQPFNDSKYYFDAGAGANFVMGNAMLGGSMLHLNKPDESFTGSRVATPIRTAIYASYRYPLYSSDPYGEDDSFIIPSVVYYKQAKANSLSAGVQYKYRGVNAGVWFRSNQKGSTDAIVFSLIFDIFTSTYNTQKVRLGLSHDATTNKLNYGNTSGTTELSVGFETGENSGKAYESVKCYDFY